MNIKLEKTHHCKEVTEPSELLQIGVCKVDISDVFHDDISLSPSSQKLRDSILDDQMILDDHEKSVKNVSNSKKGKMEESRRLSSVFLS